MRNNVHGGERSLVQRLVPVPAAAGHPPVRAGEAQVCQSGDVVGVVDEGRLGGSEGSVRDWTSRRGIEPCHEMQRRRGKADPAGK